MTARGPVFPGFSGGARAAPLKLTEHGKKRICIGFVSRIRATQLYLMEGSNALKLSFPIAMSTTF